MTSAALPALGSAHGTRQASIAVRLLQLFGFSIMAFPSDTVFKAIGAGGYVAAIFAYLMFFSYLATMLYGQHNPLEYRSPVRIALCMLWLSSLASYAMMDRGLLSSAQLSSASRWLIQLAGVSGVILVASEHLRSLDEIHRVLRAFTWGGAFCGIVAACQYWLELDLVPYIRRILPGFSLNSAVGAIAIGTRAGVNRVAGTATDPIEMGVVAGMILPLAIYLAIHDSGRPVIGRWIPVFCIGITIPITVSRGAILSAVLAAGVFILALPSARRVTALACVPMALGVVFLAAHRLLGTITQYFLIGTGDNSISHRVDNYSYVMHLAGMAPWFGRGGGTYIATGAVDLGAGHILDNEYLDIAIELGLVGVAAFTFFLIWPAVTAFRARGRSRGDQRLMDLNAALAGAALAALVASATFDAFGFPMFVMAEALVVGLIGATWLLAGKEKYNNGLGVDRSRAVAIQEARDPGDHADRHSWILRRQAKAAGLRSWGEHPADQPADRSHAIPDPGKSGTEEGQPL